MADKVDRYVIKKYSVGHRRLENYSVQKTWNPFIVFGLGFYCNHFILGKSEKFTIRFVHVWFVDAMV